jgi:K+-sensing histidine kinase KdpD
MKKNSLFWTGKYLQPSLLAVLAVLGTSIPLVLIGRDALGEAVIALLYLVPVTWSANRWGRLPGLSAALSAALVFDFFFTTPYYTLVVNRLEDWLILVFFLGVAVWVVDRIQTSLTTAREAIFMVEFTAAVSGQRTPEAVACSVARQVQQLFQARLVNVVYHPGRQSPVIAASEPMDGTGNGKPDRIIPILNSWGLVGEIQIWRGPNSELPPVESRLLQNFALQAARAFERTDPWEPGNRSVNLLANDINK